MEAFKTKYAKELENLEIENTDDLTERYISKKFKRKALKVHSDKTRSNDDEEFKELLSDYERVLKAFREMNIEANEGGEKDDLQNFFEKNNFAQEFSQSWTVFIEKEKVAAWKQELNKAFPDPKMLQGNGVQYRALVGLKFVYITLYDVAIPKMNIQGNHTCIRTFVLNNLPELYKKVTEMSDTIYSVPEIPINARIKLSAETIFTCDVCGKTYVRKALFRKHILTKHTNTIQQTRNVLIPAITVNIDDRQADSEKVVDSLEVLLQEDIVEEQAVVVEEIGPHLVEVNWQCGECEEIFDGEGYLYTHIENMHEESNDAEIEIKKVKSVLEKREQEYKSLKKDFELLERRHELMKQKHENMNNDNKNYAKRLIEVIKENTHLKETAKKDAETLEDTLNMNQVLIEEIKVKDATIEAEAFLSKLGKEKEGEIINKDAKRTYRCNKCDWSTETESYLQGHMIKHKVGQYQCQDCRENYLTKEELKDHISSAHSTTKNIQCNKCDKQFVSEHSLKQHTTSKHRNTIDNCSLPIGHPDRIQSNNSQSRILNIACIYCDKRFANGQDIEHHLKEHSENTEQLANNVFKDVKVNKPCRYFRIGVCVKGNECKFLHTDIVARNQSYLPKCNRGPECKFYMQNRCKFFHSRTSVENTYKPQYINKQCKYKSDCWSKRCNFNHPNQVFQLANKTNKIPIGSTMMNTWMDY